MDRVNHLARRLPGWAVYALGLLPAIWLLGGALAGGLGPDPVKGLERGLGEWALRFLLASLTITPLRRAGLNLLRFRRGLGQLAFFYATLHFLSWLGPDMGLRLTEVGADLVKRPYIILGLIGLAAMLPLALTSTDAAIRRMGARRWRQLHRLVYVALAAGALHLAILSKVWSGEVLIYCSAAVVLLAFRLRGRPARPQSA